MKKDFIQSAKIIILALVVGLGVSYISAAGGFTAPPCSSPTGCNAEAPINTSSTGQSKVGALGVGGLAVFGQTNLFGQLISTSTGRFQGNTAGTTNNYLSFGYDGAHSFINSNKGAGEGGLAINWGTDEDVSIGGGPTAGDSNLTVSGSTTVGQELKVSSKGGSGNAYACFDGNGQFFRSTSPCIATSAPACSDGTDNDGDGQTDFPNDPGCYGSTDPDESNATGSVTLTAAQPIITITKTAPTMIANPITYNTTTTLTLSGSNIISCSASSPTNNATGFSGTVTPQTYTVNLNNFGVASFGVTCNTTSGTQTANATVTVRGVQVWDNTNNNLATTSTFNFPSTASSTSNVKLWGAGGAGGRYQAPDAIHPGGAGGGGASGEYLSYTPGSFSNSYALTLGVGGDAAAFTSGPGTYTQIVGGPASPHKVYGGNPGVQGIPTGPGAAGTGCSGGTTTGCVSGSGSSPGINNGNGAGGVGGTGTTFPSLDGSGGRIEISFQ